MARVLTAAFTAHLFPAEQRQVAVQLPTKGIASVWYSRKVNNSTRNANPWRAGRGPATPIRQYSHHGVPAKSAGGRLGSFAALRPSPLLTDSDIVPKGMILCEKLLVAPWPVASCGAIKVNHLSIENALGHRVWPSFIFLLNAVVVGVRVPDERKENVRSMQSFAKRRI
jgi:hypothetical protein